MPDTVELVPARIDGLGSDPCPEGDVWMADRERRLTPAGAAQPEARP
jgi:hypothetical protein